MRVWTKTDTTGFDRMVRSIVRRTGRTIRNVVDTEAAGILEVVVDRAQVADADSIVRRQMEKQWRKMDGKLYYLANRYPDSTWAKLEAARAESIRRRLAGRGLTKLSWLQIAKALRLKVEAPEYAARAVNRRGRQPKMGRGTRRGDGKSYVVTLINKGVVAVFTGGRRLLRAVMTERATNYRAQTEKAFTEQARVAASGTGAYVK